MACLEDAFKLYAVLQKSKILPVSVQNIIFWNHSFLPKLFFGLDTIAAPQSVVFQLQKATPDFY